MAIRQAARAAIERTVGNVERLVRRRDSHGDFSASHDRALPAEHEPCEPMPHTDARLFEELRRGRRAQSPSTPASAADCRRDSRAASGGTKGGGSSTRRSRVTKPARGRPHPRHDLCGARKLTGVTSAARGGEGRRHAGRFGARRQGRGCALVVGVTTGSHTEDELAGLTRTRIFISDLSDSCRKARV